MVLSSVFFLDIRGKVILYRNYRGDIPHEAAEKFITLLADFEEEQRTVVPVLTSDGVSYVHIRHANLYSTIAP